ELVSAVSAAVARGMAGSFGFPVTTRVQGMSATLRREYHQWKLGAALFSAAGLIALLVAGVGIYSTIACIVGQRRHEIGVRIALGAQGGHVARVVIAQGVKVVVVGVVIGIAVALALGKLVASLLYGVTAHDPVVLGAVPAGRAARVDPMETLRAE